MELLAITVIYSHRVKNFIADQRFTQYVCVDDIFNYFATSKITVSTRSKKFEDPFSDIFCDFESSTKRIKGKNPSNEFVHLYI